jgi:hypothetical protein
MEAFLFYLQNNTPENLELYDMNSHQIIHITRAISSNNIPIQELSIFDPLGIDPDEMREVFEMIGQINTLRVLEISHDNITYRMNDLADLLERTSLDNVVIHRCNIILDGDVTRLSRVLIHHPTLSIVGLYGRSHENTTDFIDSFPEQYILNRNPNVINLYWTSQHL